MWLTNNTRSVTRLEVSLGYFIRENNRCKISRPLTSDLFNLINGFQCIIHHPDPKCWSVKSRTRVRSGDTKGDRVKWNQCLFRHSLLPKDRQPVHPNDWGVGTHCVNRPCPSGLSTSGGDVPPPRVGHTWVKEENSWWLNYQVHRRWFSISLCRIPVVFMMKAKKVYLCTPCSLFIRKGLWMSREFCFKKKKNLTYMQLPVSGSIPLSRPKEIRSKRAPWTSSVSKSGRGVESESVYPKGSSIGSESDGWNKLPFPFCCQVYSIKLCS